MPLPPLSNRIFPTFPLGRWKTHSLVSRAYLLRCPLRLFRYPFILPTGKLRPRQEIACPCPQERASSLEYSPGSSGHNLLLHLLRIRPADSHSFIHLFIHTYIGEILFVKQDGHRSLNCGEGKVLPNQCLLHPMRYF